MGEEEEQAEGDEGILDEKEVEYEHGGEQELVTLSLSSMVGLIVERAMKMMRMIWKQQVVVLIDSGATSNFISEKLVQGMGLQVTETRGFGVRVGGGQVI